MNMRIFCLSTIAILMGLPVICAAGRTSTVVDNSYERWMRGDATRVMIEPEGVIRLAPELVSTGVFPVPMLDAVLIGDDGCVYAASAGKVYLRHLNGSNELIVAFEQEKVTALTLDQQGTLYIGVSPGGVIYRRESGGAIVRAADTGQRYIWALHCAPDGALLAATGHNGLLQRIVFSGAVARVTTVLDSTEENITSLAQLGGVVYAGTSPRGYVYRIEGTNQPFLLLDTRAAEATSLLAESNGVVWVTTMGSRAPSAPAPAPTPAAALSALTGSVAAAPGMTGAPPAPVPPAGGARLFRIAPDGFSEVYWQSTEPVLFALAQAADGTIYVGSGNKGRLFAVRDRGRAALAAQLPARQIVAVQAAADGGVRIVCTEPASLFALGAGVAASGRFESAALTIADLARWGRVDLDATRPEQVRVLTRSGNSDTPDSSWSPWAPLDALGRIASPAARVLQYALELSAADGVSPAVRAVRVFYAEPNRAPVLDAVAVSPAHIEVVPQPTPAAAPPAGGNVTQLVQEWLAAAGIPANTPAGAAPPGAPASGPGVLRLNSFGYRTIAWSAQDPNGDALSAWVWISTAADTPEWIPLAKQRPHSFLSFNAREWADGRYRVRVRVSDVAGAADAGALHAERLSDTFVIDHTPPVFENVTLAREDGGLRVSCTVRDALSVIASVQYAFDTREPRPLLPADGVYDTGDERIDTLIPLPPNAGYLRLIASDESKNVSGLTRAVPAP